MGRLEGIVSRLSTVCVCARTRAHECTRTHTRAHSHHSRGCDEKHAYDLCVGDQVLLGQH